MMSEDEMHHISNTNINQNLLRIINGLKRELELSQRSKIKLTDELRQSQLSSNYLTEELHLCQKGNLNILEELQACQTANSILRDELENVEKRNFIMGRENERYRKANNLLREEIRHVRIGSFRECSGLNTIKESILEVKEIGNDGHLSQYGSFPKSTYYRMDSVSGHSDYWSLSEADETESNCSDISTDEKGYYSMLQI